MPIKKNEIFKRVRRVIVEKLIIEESEVKYESHIVNDLGADSLDQIEIIMAIEVDFSMSIPDEVMEDFEKVEDIVNYIEDKLPR